MHCTALTKPVTDCKRSSSSSFSDKLLLNFTSAFRDVAPHCRTQKCQQLDFIVISAGRLILIVWRIFTGISQTIRYRPSLIISTTLKCVIFLIFYCWIHHINSWTSKWLMCSSAGSRSLSPWEKSMSNLCRVVFLRQGPLRNLITLNRLEEFVPGSIRKMDTNPPELSGLLVAGR